MATILVLEDDPSLSESITLALRDAGHHVLAAMTLAEARQQAFAVSVDLAICDVNLPDGDGFTFCRWLKARRETVVLFLSARDLEEDLLAGYALGAEDYITKPFSMKVLLAKIAVVLGRISAQTAVIDDGWLRIDFTLGSVTCGGEKVRMTPTELKLLRILTDHRGQLLTYHVLLDALWDVGVELSDKHVLAVHVNRLRKKLEDETHTYIANVYGMGYLWK
ncbi:MAG: response regulator transcription factor [Peptococcaceae bacterium]|nr:response regulator transcription factor [Peptococcaceae bacterium]